MIFSTYSIERDPVMLNESQISRMRATGRYVGLARTGDEDLGPLKLLPGTWKNVDGFEGRGWNMIALPFATRPGSPIDYRLLVNQHNEELKFTLVDKAVPNRGVDRTDPNTTVETDQFVVTLDYEQVITQIATDDNPVSGLAGNPGIAIHHEPGLWLHMTNLAGDFDIARLGTIPHGDSVLGLGASAIVNGPPTIPAINGLPIGVNQDLNSPYLAPYKHFSDNPFKGVVTAPGFPGFNPVQPHLLLQGPFDGTVTRTTVLRVDTRAETGGIVNIPFIVKQANAAEMISTFWIVEVEKDGVTQLILQYLQIVLLDFFSRRDGLPGMIRWPHVSINTMVKCEEPTYETVRMPSAAV